MYDRLRCILPQELVDAVVDEIPVEETQTLQSCTLVARALYYRAHKRLFSTIILRSSRYAHHREQFDPYARLFQYMSRMPCDAALVTDLRLHDFYLPASGSWFAEDEILVPTIINLLPNLESIAINGLDTSLSRGIMASLRKLLASPKLVNIAFSKVLFRPDSQSLLSLFKVSTDPKNITIHGGLNFYGDIDYLPPTGVNPINSLSIRMYPAAATDFVDCLLGSRCPLDLRTLKRLEIHSTWMQHAGIFNRLLLPLKGTLEELVVHTSNTSSRTLTLHHIPRVECHIDCINSHPLPFVALASVFGTEPHHMETVKIHLRAHHHSWNVSQGGPLDAILAKVKHQVVMHVVVEDLHDSYDIMRSVRTSLPQTCKRGVLLLEASRTRWNYHRD